MPLTEFQSIIAQLLSINKTPDSYLAGGAALHIEPNSIRYSNDLDYFHDTVKRVAEVFNDDRLLLEEKKYAVEINIQQPGYIRAIILKNGSSTKIEWAHDSAWRFLPTVYSEQYGYQLHPVDLAINKVLALAGRDEARDFLDIQFIMKKIIPLGCLCWAASAKDPGFTPLSLHALLCRRSKYQQEDFDRLHLTEKVNLQDLKQKWLTDLEEAKAFIESRPIEELGCLYYSKTKKKFVIPSSDMSDIVLHFGKPGGIVPRIVEE